VSTDGIADLLARAPSLTADANRPAADGPDRERLKTLAAEFESMLLLQMLKEMRKAGSWDDEGDGDTLGAETLLETLDVELAKHLSSVQSLGLRQELVQAFDRKFGAGSKLPAEAGSHELHPAGSSSSRKHEISLEPSTATAFAPIHASGADVLDSLNPMDELTRPAGKVTSAFGWRADPFSGSTRFHGGIDVRAAYGQEVNSAGAGRVVFSGDERGYGTTVIVEHADGVRTRYAHLSAALVQKGDAVAAGAVLGRAGQSGRATGPHLHFEVIANGVRVDPATLAPPEAGHTDAVASEASVRDVLRRASSGLKPEGVVADLAGRRTTPFRESE
jgi:murein DD-endopeptidase MepM/ murein hydrolase activator NlpD